MKRISILIASASFLFGCGGGSISTPPSIPVTNATITGTVEKGPFSAGSILTLNILDAAGTSTGETVITTIGSDLGNFSVRAEPGQFLQIVANGRFRNEITGSLSVEDISLQALHQVSDQAIQSVNINLLTHITSTRALELVRTGNASFVQAIDRAETEFLSAFSGVVNQPAEFGFAELSIFGTPQTNGSSYLLLISSLFYQHALERSGTTFSRPEIELSELLEQLQSDFGVDGDFDDSLEMVELRNTLKRLNPDQINLTLAGFLLGRTGFTIPDVNALLDSDLDGFVNAIDEDDDNDGILDDFDTAPFDYNDSPSITGIPPSEILAFQDFGFLPSASDMDGDSLTFSIENKPSWLDFNEENGALSGIATNEDAGIFSDIIISVTDGNSSVRLETFSISVIVNPWVPLAEMPSDSYVASATGSDSQIYVTGGHSGPIGPGTNAFDQDNFFIYDIASNTWHSNPAMPTRRIQHTSHFIGDELFVLGGTLGNDFSSVEGEVLSSVEAFNVITETWSDKSPMNNGRYSAASCVVDELIYVFGGYISGTATDSVEMYDPLTDTWMDKTAMSAINANPECVVLNDLIYVLGGSSGSNWTTFRIYDPAIDNWLEGGDLPVQKIYGFSVGVVEDKIYLVGGFTTENSVHVYDPSLDSWAVGTSLLRKRVYMSSTVVNNQLYILGGLSRTSVGSSIVSTEYLDEVIVFRPSM